MLSHNYRMKLEAICEKIVKGETVELNEIIWAEKLAKSNRSAATILRQARRRAENPDMNEMDNFLNQLDIGGFGNDRFGKRGFDSIDDMMDWWSEDRPPDWRQYDQLWRHQAQSGVKSALQTGKHWYNNGKINRFDYECPDGFVPGMLRRKK